MFVSCLFFEFIPQVVRNPMIEKPNKDGKPPTVEYQEEEILVSAERCLTASVCISLNAISLMLYLPYLLASVGHCLWSSGKAMLQYVQGECGTIMF